MKKKKMDAKLTLNRETLRALNPTDMAAVAGGATYAIACTGGSNSNATCDSCFGPDC
jgi:natural product precursor